LLIFIPFRNIFERIAPVSGLDYWQFTVFRFLSGCIRLNRLVSEHSVVEYHDSYHYTGKA